MISAPLTIGVEEEYQIIDPDTRELSAYVSKIMGRGRVVLGDQIKNEFMQSQVEVGTKVCRDVHEARAELQRLRRTVMDLAAEHGRVIAAASTHPFSKWTDQAFSEGERYDDLLTSMQDAVRRLLIFGLHVHIGIGKDDEAQELTIDLLNQMRYFLPHILAFSTSSPFFEGRLTGMKSYRSLIFENMPRSGIPPRFYSYAEYENFLKLMAKVGSLGAPGSGKYLDASTPIDPTKIWWDARPHPRWGTLEVRVADMCTTLDEAMMVVGLVQALIAKFIKLRNSNRSWRIYPTHLIDENKWRAVRYGTEGYLIDFGRKEEAPLKQLAGEILEVVDDVLDELGSRQDVERILTICERGNSADRQLAAYQAALKNGVEEKEALQAVVDLLVSETRLGVD
jgi:carboxylate-amine ligase